MLHTKFQGHWPFGSGEEDFLRFLPYMGMAAILVMWPGSFEQTFVPHAMKAPYEIWLWLTKQFLRRRCLKSVDDDGRRRTTTDDDGRRPTYPISSPVSLRLRWAKKPGAGFITSVVIAQEIESIWYHIFSCYCYRLDTVQSCKLMSKTMGLYCLSWVISFWVRIM